MGASLLALAKSIYYFVLNFLQTGLSFENIVNGLCYQIQYWFDRCCEESGILILIKSLVFLDDLVNTSIIDSWVISG